MIKTLFIKDFILIDEVEVNFNKGLNILTGETGSGKSIIIDAIDLAFGARGTKDIIKNNAAKALIELTIAINPDFPVEILEENGIDIDNENILIISREITQSATRSRINGVLVPQNLIQNIRKYLIDIHSQLETFNYIQPKTHIDLLDKYGNSTHKELLNTYKNTFSDYKSVKKELEIAQSLMTSGEQKIDFLKFQVEEITAAKIENLNEYNDLLHERSILLNAEELKEITYSGYEILYNQESSIIDILNTLKNKLIKASEFDESLSNLAETIDTSSINLKDAANELRNYTEFLETDPARLKTVEQRIELLDKLKRKYGPELSDVLNNLDNFELELNEINLSYEIIKELTIKQSNLHNQILDLADKLTNSRQTIASDLSEKIQNKLVKLEMPKVQFKVNIQPAKEYLYNGNDDVEFLISPNVGETLKPLSKIASGGEISRVILAIKTIFAESDNVNTVIFDEIDTGISGKTSQSVAESLAELGINQQILCITHQPIIAAMADKHLYISKIQDDISTKVMIKELDYNKKISALATLASGSSTNEESVNFAVNLLEQAAKLKNELKHELCKNH